MIELHRLGQPEPFQLNPDLIVTVEAHPDTVIHLATFAGTTIEKIKLIPTLYKQAMSGEKPDMNAQLELLVGFAERARREGLLALDEEVAELEDDFTRKGLQLVVDGTDPELVREIL